MRRKNTVVQFHRLRARRWPAAPQRAKKRVFYRRRRVSVRSLLRWLTIAPALLLTGMLIAERLGTAHDAPVAAAAVAPATPGSAAQPVMPADRASARATRVPVTSARSTVRPVSVVWVDGDSGTIDGREFRLYGVDAPEGSPHRAKCSGEQAKAEAAGRAARALTRSGDVRISGYYGIDRYDRQLVSLSAEGRDVAGTLVARGHLKWWNYQHQPKPDWCK